MYGRKRDGDIYRRDSEKYRNGIKKITQENGIG